MTRNVKIVLGAAAGLTGIVWLAASGTGSPDGPWARATRADLVLDVEVTGELEAVDTSKLGPPAIDDQWDYKISFLAPEGAQVSAGSPVIGFDTSELERKLEQKEAEADEARKKIDKRRADADMARRQDELRTAEAEARLRKARLKVDVPEELSASRDLTKSRLELEEAEREIAFLSEKVAAARKAEQVALAALEKQRDGAERRVREIREAIASMSVTAPRDGTVVYVSNWRDEKKKVGDTVWRREKAVEIPDLRRMRAKAEVDEADAGRIAEGQKVGLRLDAHPDVEFTGKVASIWSTVQRKSWRDPLKVVRLDVTLDTTDTVRMRPGMRFRGRVETERVRNVLMIPSEAVFTTADGPVAYRKRLGGWDVAHLELGRRNASSVEVLGGLGEGDEVALHDLAASEGRAARSRS